MKRKLIGVILMAVMVCSLAACGSKETKETKADADKSGTPVLRVAMECGYAPYNWTQSDDSNGAVPIEDSKDYAYGYDVMMAKKIADKLGCELRKTGLGFFNSCSTVRNRGLCYRRSVNYF